MLGFLTGTSGDTHEGFGRLPALADNSPSHVVDDGNPYKVAWHFPMVPDVNLSPAQWVPLPSSDRLSVVLYAAHTQQLRKLETVNPDGARVKTWVTLSWEHGDTPQDHGHGLTGSHQAIQQRAFPTHQVGSSGPLN